MRSMIVASVCLAVASAAGQTALAGDGPGMFAGEPEVLDFAIFDVCLPYLRNGGALLDYTGRSGREGTLNNVPAIRLSGGYGRIWVGAGRQGSDRCYVVGQFGLAPAERQEVLASFAKHGVRLDPLVGPNEFLLKQGGWYDMIEDYCFRTDGRVARVRLRTSTKGALSQGFRHTPLEMSLAWDKDDEALKNGHCAE